MKIYQKEEAIVNDSKYTKSNSLFAISRNKMRNVLSRNLANDPFAPCE
jgi:hypothetical protein